MLNTVTGQERSPADLISARIAELDDRRGETLRYAREIIRKADPDITEEGKWRGNPAWSHHGIVSTGESYGNHVKRARLQSRTGG